MLPSRQLWRPAPPQLTLDDTSVHIWSAVLDQPEACARHLAQLCAPEEHARAQRFRSEQNKQRFLARRGILRTILSCYGAGEPQHLKFTRPTGGKPALEEPPDRPPIQFNTSHSHALFLCAVARTLTLGVDVEHVRAMPDAERVAAHFFAPGEYATWRSLPDTEQLDAFFVCWTRKEAYIKATGEGLARPLDSFEVSLRPGAPPRLLRDAHDPQNVARFRFHDLRPAAGYMASLAVQGRDYSIECWQWDA